MSADAQEVHVVNYHARVSSKDGAGTVQINVKRVNNPMESDKTTLGATEQLRTHIARNVPPPYGTWTQSIDDGATLILRT